MWVLKSYEELQALKREETPGYPGIMTDMKKYAGLSITDEEYEHVCTAKGFSGKGPMAEITRFGRYYYCPAMFKFVPDEPVQVTEPIYEIY